MRSIVSPCVLTVFLLLLGVLVSVSPANGYYHGDNQYQQHPRAAETGIADRVFKEISYKLWILWIKNSLSAFTQSCDTFQSIVLSESFRTNTLSRECIFLSDTCGKAETALYSSDCFARSVAIALEVTCCQGVQVTVTTPKTTPTTRSTTRTTPTTTTTTTTSTTTTNTPQPTPQIQSCGVASALIPKIVGGTDTSECELPWVVGIRRNGVFVCGGAIVSNHHVITAGHCASADAVYSIEVSKWGTNSAQDRFWQLIPVTKKAVIESYDSFNLLNDIAVLTLARPVSFGLCVQPICLPQRFEIPQTEKCTVAGWGTLQLGGGLPALLQKVDLKVYLPDVCAVRFDEGPTVVTSAVMCAENDGLGGKDACQGDSGGPLMCIVNGKSTLMGIVSSGRGCADAGEAGFYTFVPYFREWLNTQIF